MSPAVWREPDLHPAPTHHTQKSALLGTTLNRQAGCCRPACAQLYTDRRNDAHDVDGVLTNAATTTRPGCQPCAPHDTDDPNALKFINSSWIRSARGSLARAGPSACYYTLCCWRLRLPASGVLQPQWTHLISPTTPTMEHWRASSSSTEGCQSPSTASSTEGRRNPAAGASPTRKRCTTGAESSCLPQRPTDASSFWVRAAPARPA